MNVTTLRIDLQVVDGRTLGEKRRLLRAIFAKLRRNFNVSVAEVDRLDRPDSAAIGVVVVAATRREAREALDRVFEAVAAHPRLDVLAKSLTEV